MGPVSSSESRIKLIKRQIIFDRSFSAVKSLLYLFSFFFQLHLLFEVNDLKKSEKSSQPALYSNTKLLMASVTESAALNKSCLQSKLIFEWRPELSPLPHTSIAESKPNLVALSVAPRKESVSIDGLLPRLDEDDGVERGDCC